MEPIAWPSPIVENFQSLAPVVAFIRFASFDDWPGGAWPPQPTRISLAFGPTDNEIGSSPEYALVPVVALESMSARRWALNVVIIDPLLVLTSTSPCCVTPSYVSNKPPTYRTPLVARSACTLPPVTPFAHKTLPADGSTALTSEVSPPR